VSSVVTAGGTGFTQVKLAGWIRNFVNIIAEISVVPCIFRKLVPQAEVTATMHVCLCVVQ